MPRENTNEMHAVSVHGIPAFAKVTHYVHREGSGNMYTAASDMDYYGYTEIEWELYDRTGYRAAWLEKKLTPGEHARIEYGLIEDIKRCKYEGDY